MTANKILVVNLAPGYLMARAIEQLVRAYSGSELKLIEAQVGESAKDLEDLADRPEVVAVVVVIDDSPKDLGLLEGILRERLADVYMVSGHGTDRKARAITSVEELNILKRSLGHIQ
jgi:hypothetical protein